MVQINEDAVTPEQALSVQAFLLREARLLDNECWDEWLSCLSEAVHYWMPGIENRRREDKLATYTQEHMAYFDDTLRDLKRRVARFKQPSAWAENPPTRNVHIITNIEVFAGAEPGEFIAHSCFNNVRSRGLNESTQLAGRREDLLRLEAEGLKLLKRKILIPNAMLLYKNINTFL